MPKLEVSDRFLVVVTRQHVSERDREFLKEVKPELHETFDLCLFLEHRLGLDLKEGDEIEITAKVVSRVKEERYDPREVKP